MARPLLIALLYVLFFLSGAAALVYQVVWVRSLTLVFGGTHLAVTAVLSIFMTGLALGGYAIGRHVDRIAKPLRLYAKNLGVLPATPTPVTEVVSIAEGQPPRFPDPPPPPGFRMAEKRVTASYELIRYVSASPQPVSGATLSASKIGPKPPFFLLRKDTP